MTALVFVVAEKVFPLKKANWRREVFDGITLTVLPQCPEMYNNPEYHSLVGQKFVYADFNIQQVA